MSLASGKRIFENLDIFGTSLEEALAKLDAESTLTELVACLDFMHIKTGLVEAYHAGYPLVEPRELVPAFDAPLIEYKGLPAFSLVALDRPISYQDEGVQFDLLCPEGEPPLPGLTARNRQVLRQRLPRDQIPLLEEALGRKAITSIDRYAQLLPHLAKMDRGQVIARGLGLVFHLVGIFASFPSDLDGEIKRLGRRIGKFKKGDNPLYLENRDFVYRFLMEQSGFPVCGERHTSAALFARRLLRRRENFAIKVLGVSDRTITTLTSIGATYGLPRVEKTALVAARGCSGKGRHLLEEGGFILDQRRDVVILRVHYGQHSYHPDNVLEDRALSVASQEVVHPVTGETLELDVLGLSQDRLLLLNDLVRGEHIGSIVYRGREQIQGTTQMEQRLKFLSAWLTKNRHLLADYSPDNFERVRRILSTFLGDEKLSEEFARTPGLHQEVKDLLAELRLDHRLRLLEKLVQSRTDSSGRRLQHVHILIILVHVLGNEGLALANGRQKYLRKLLRLCGRVLDNAYLRRRYFSKPPQTAIEREVVGEYNLLKRLAERFKSQAAV